MEKQEHGVLFTALLIGRGNESRAANVVLQQRGKHWNGREKPCGSRNPNLFPHLSENDTCPVECHFQPCGEVLLSAIQSGTTGRNDGNRRKGYSWMNMQP